tara:strand:- start:136 stop:645 length:510 start_codon:yes stop_codon:yes gene_type:complete
MKENKNYWFVVMSKPNQEVKAIKNLKNQNFDVFSPYFEKEQSNGKITKIVKEFLFPSYIFVKFNLENYKWLKIKYTHGVKKILSIGSIPSQIEKNFIENLKNFSNQEGRINNNFFFFKPKEKIIITKGPFRKIFGEIVSVVGKNRIKVLLDFVTNKKTLVLDKDCILPN